jgi:hypothetical protein
MAASVVMAMTFGTIVRNNDLRDLGIRSAALGFMICIMFGGCLSYFPNHQYMMMNKTANTGYVFGLVSLNFTKEWNPLSVWPTSEMVARGQWRTLWIGVLVALPSGAAVAVSLLSGNQSSLVGVAISASLLPPCVNAVSCGYACDSQILNLFNNKLKGLLWAFATLKAIKSIGEQTVYVQLQNQVWKNIKPALIPPTDYRVNYLYDNMALELIILGIVGISNVMMQ